MATLNWWTHDGIRQVMGISRPITSVGSSVRNDISIQNMDLEEYHLQIIFDGRDFYVKSASGESNFFVNGKKKKKARLVHKDAVSAGKAEIIFEMLAAPSTASPADSASELQNLKRLQQFSAELFELDSVDRILEKLMDSVIEITGAAKGFLVLFEDGVPAVKVARNIRRENMEDSISQLSDTIIAEVVRNRKALIVTDAKNSEQFAKSESVLSLNLSSVMCVPLLQKDSLLGLIYLGNDTVRGLFENRTLETLNIFAAQASLIV